MTGPELTRPWWRTRLASRSLLVLGLVLATLSLAADYLTGAARAEIGFKQVLGGLFGLGVCLAGVLLSPARQAVGGETVRWACALYFATCALSLALLGPPAAATWVLLGYAAAICLLAPLRFGVATLSGVLAVHLLATVISRVKVGLTGMPLTMLDIRIAVRNPAGLWDALSFPHWTRYLTVAVAAVILLWWIVAGVRAARRSVTGIVTRGTGPIALGRLLAMVALVGLAVAYLENLYVGMGADKRTWHPDGVAEMAERVGVLPFLAYSYRIESSATGDIYASDAGAAALSREEVSDAVLEYVGFPAGNDDPAVGMLPNIAVLLAESTFDPGYAFRLEGEWNDELFAAGPYTVAAGPLKVNAIGGGTWITEFETIVGLDSRLFGYAGSYTHASIAPFVERSIASYLRDRGYRTWAFFPHQGNFYNARRAYEGYGFQVVRDSEDLGQGSWVENDRQIVASVATTLGTEPRAPFLAYVVLLENHAPHRCDVADASSFTTRFTGVGEFEPNCALHEYLRRLESTTAAVRAMRQYLTDLEARTGRPFVLLVFGDHQPHTFTSTGGLQFDYAPLRRAPDGYTTFFHLQSSAPGRVKCCSVAPPAAMLPTLLSTFVASGPDDVYLGENLWLFSRCGSDAIRRQFGDGMTSPDVRGTDDRTQACRSAYQRALASYRAAGVIRLTAETRTGTRRTAFAAGDSGS